MIRRNYLLPEESLHLKVTNRDKTEQNNPIKHCDEVPFSENILIYFFSAVQGKEGSGDISKRNMYLMALMHFLEGKPLKNLNPLLKPGEGERSNHANHLSHMCCGEGTIPALSS